MKPKFIPLNDPLYRYVCASRSNPDDPVLTALREETGRMGEDAFMQIGADQGSFLTVLTAAIGARRALEIGTFTGYSSICIARGLPSDGRLLCLDLNAEWTAVARRYWEQAGVADRIELRLGPALDSLARLEPEWTFDLVFIDAHKLEYAAYYERVLPRVRPNGLILFDNMLREGRVARESLDDEGDRAIDQLNRQLARDPRIETVLLTVADGIQLCRKRG